MPDNEKLLARLEEFFEIYAKIASADTRLPDVNEIDFAFCGGTSRLGYCKVRSKQIRISTQTSLNGYFVRTACHEIAHLVDPSHGRGFWMLLGKYLFVVENKIN